MANEGMQLPENDKLTDEELNAVAGGSINTRTNLLRKVLNDVRDTLGIEHSGNK